MNKTARAGIRITRERHKLSDGSTVDDVVIRWDGGMVTVATESQKHAERLFAELMDAPNVDVTTWENSSAASRRKERR
jgi:hypothetical protein